MPNQIVIFLLDTVLNLFSVALLLRFYFQLFRVPYYHPVTQFLITVTDFVVRPARRVIPGWRGLDLSTLVLAWLTQFLILTGVNAMKGNTVGDYLAAFLLMALFSLISITVYVLFIMIIAQAVLSWINPHSPLAPILDSFTAPILRPLRRFMPPIANIDLTPLAAIILLQILMMVVENMQRSVLHLF